MSFSTSRSRGLSVGVSSTLRRWISPTSPAARLGATTSRPFAQFSTRVDELGAAGLLGDEAGRALLQRAVDDRRLVVRGDQQHPGRQFVARDGRGDLSAVEAGHPVVEQRHLRPVFADQFQRRHPVVGLGDHVDRSAGLQRAHHAVAEERVVVTHHHAHLLARPAGHGVTPRPRFARLDRHAPDVGRRHVSDGR